MDMLLERLFEIQQGDAVTVVVPVEQAVASHRNVREDESPQRNLRLNGAAGAYTEDIKGLVLRLDLAGFEIHVSQGVKLRHNDVDVVGAYTGRQGGNPFAVVKACSPDKFAG